ncbi:MAG: hypothetical protein WC755_06265 [Candidatus Woesearchaeota archaeon]|jgi:hypothetical protein
MAGFFNVSSTELISKINTLSSKIDRTQSFFGKASRSEWNEIFELCKEINEDFKNVKFPVKNERDTAWKNFFNLRDKAYKVRNEQIFDLSKKHYDDLMSQLQSADYNSIGDFLVGKIMSLGLMATTKDEMKIKGSDLKQIGLKFSSVKSEITREHKDSIFKRIIEVRKNHDIFWERYKSYSIEKQKDYEEKNSHYKSKIENNIESNIEKRNKAQDALERFKVNRNELQNKIYDSYNDDWKSKAEDWLDDFDNKIRDIDEQIERYEKWIYEDREKLRNWND